MALAYVEVIGTPYGWVWIDPAGYGHRSAAYRARWVALGGTASGWVQNADGTFTSEQMIPIHGYPLDPSLPTPESSVLAPRPETFPVMLAAGIAAVAVLWWLSKGR